MKITRKTSVQLCPQCSAVLEEGTSASNLVTIKNRGGLKAPSKRVFDVCFHIEQMIRTNKDKIFLPGFIERVIQEILFDHFVHFADTTDHTEHKKEILKLVAVYYLKLRLKHEATILSEVDNYIRRTFTKLITFKNQ